MAPSAEAPAPPAAEIEWISNDPSLPKVILYHIVGATLRMLSGQSTIDDVAYGGGKPLSYDTIIRERVPEILNIAQVGLVGPYYYMSYVEIAQHFNKHVAPEDSGIAGAVVVCGTNNLDELAFGLNQTTASPKPLIVSGAMRPLSLLSSDGPLNLYHSFSAVIHPTSRDRGVMTLFSNRLVSAQFVSKIHANGADTFKALEQGSLGYMLAGRPFYYFPAAQPNGRQCFDVSGLEGTLKLPKVALFAYHLDYDTDLYEAAVQNGAKGMVIAVSGFGVIDNAARAVALKIAKQGIPVVISIRHPSGFSVPFLRDDPLIHSCSIASLQSRILLQLALATGMDNKAIRKMFEAEFMENIFEGNWAAAPREP